MSFRTLGPVPSERVRERVRALIKARFGGSVTDASDALHLAHSTLYEFLGGKRNAGLHLLTTLAAYLAVPIDELVKPTGAYPNALPEPEQQAGAGHDARWLAVYTAVYAGLCVHTLTHRPSLHADDLERHMRNAACAADADMQSRSPIAGHGPQGEEAPPHD